mmetsp:Transcript_130217/g.243644  ORF Transcript_130217/g.243644 Transcript_130217/m.243644 type:complete len:363 (-) Transcript_130217:150-1238(-)
MTRVGCRLPLAAVCWWLLTSCEALTAALELPSGNRAAGIDNVLGDVATPNIEDRRPNYARVDGSIETLWQRPAGQIAGVLFFAHGCKHQATDFFYKNSGTHQWQFQACDKSYFGRCLGLPEERQFVELARSRNYLVMAVSGGTGRQSCWDMDGDRSRVEKALRHVFQHEGLSLGKMPILATGASSGGQFMGPLALHLSSLHDFKKSLRCVIPQISAFTSLDASEMTVPTFFLPMARDKRTLQVVNENVEAITRNNARVSKQEVADVPVADEFEDEQYGISHGKQVVTQLEVNGFLDDQGKLKEDPRSSDWRSALKSPPSVIDGVDTLAPDESAVAELLNVAYAQHEFTSRYAREALDFCEGQ